MEQIRTSEDCMQLSLLFKIMAVSEMNRINELEDMVYEFGSNLKESDILGRQIFIWMATLLRDA